MKNQKQHYAYVKYINNFNNEYFYLLEDNYLGFLILFIFFSELENKNLSYEYFKNKLLLNGSLDSQTGDYLYSHTAWIDKNNKNMICIGTTKTQNPDFIKYLLEIYPTFTYNDIEEAIYTISLNNFLEILKSYLENLHKKTSYMHLYEDDKKWVHFNKYHPTDEEIKKWNIYGE